MNHIILNETCLIQKYIGQTDWGNTPLIQQVIRLKDSINVGIRKGYMHSCPDTDIDLDNVC